MNDATETGKRAGFAFGGFFLGILVGAVIGGVTALMLAPKSGEETRGMVMDRFNQAKESVRSGAQGVKQSVMK